MKEGRREAGRQTGKKQEEEERQERELCLMGTFQGCMCHVTDVERRLASRDKVI